jgi:hypothetical protein
MTRRKKARPCSVRWCLCLAQPDGELCAVHAKYKDLKLGLPLDNGELDCETCGGSGNCLECDGDGEHTCDCGHEHSCPKCDGSGDCKDCGGNGEGLDGRKDLTGFDREYLEWVFAPALPTVPDFARDI